jgi:hypothetical protein
MNTFQKVMLFIIPIIVLLLISAIVMCLALIFLPLHGGFYFQTGNLTIIMALCSAVLAIVGIVFSVVVKGNDDDEEE